jgi:hypothetical protein
MNNIDSWSDDSSLTNITHLSICAPEYHWKAILNKWEARGYQWEQIKQNRDKLVWITLKRKDQP